MNNIDQYRKAALEIINEYYYALPNNGYINHGLLSCDRRYKEGIQCAIIGVKRIILILEFMSTESNDPAIMGRINFYDKIQDELYKIQADNSGIKLNDLPSSSEYEISEDEAVAYFERAEKMNKARKYSSPLIEELLNEITPEEMEKTRLEMEAMIPKFKVGDKLKAIDYDREHHGLEYVTITSINEEKQVYHWEADEVLFELSGKIHSGYFFHEAIEYK